MDRCRGRIRRILRLAQEQKTSETTALLRYTSVDDIIQWCQIAVYTLNGEFTFSKTVALSQITRQILKSSVKRLVIYFLSSVLQKIRGQTVQDKAARIR